MKQYYVNRCATCDTTVITRWDIGNNLSCRDFDHLIDCCDKPNFIWVWNPRYILLDSELVDRCQEG